MSINCPVPCFKNRLGLLFYLMLKWMSSFSVKEDILGQNFMCQSWYSEAKKLYHSASLESLSRDKDEEIHLKLEQAFINFKLSGLVTQ